ncbi:MAG: DUF2500 domain-containing protein [Pirellulaceae bacterium]|nr:DUF2500 domain-containing protein [Pirellulaceae bacterium]
MKCPSCGGESELAAAVCGYCGSALPRPAAEDKLATFRRLKASPEFARSGLAERHEQLPKYEPAHKLLLGGFFVVFIGGSLVAFVVTLAMALGFGFAGSRFGRGGALFSLVPLLMALAPLGFVLLGVFGYRALRQKMHRIESAPVEALPVIVVDKRTHVSGGGDTSTTSSYFATCETEDGDRRECQLWDASLYSKLVLGDAGILFLRAGYGLDFDRVTPPSARPR